MTEFIGVTISNLKYKYLPLTIKSINSFLRFHDTKLIVYIIGDKELPIHDDRIEIIRLPDVKYDDSKFNLKYPEHRSIIDIFIEKLLCLTRHHNFMFFENDVFFLKNMDDIWCNMNDGVGFVPVNNELMNTGLILAKNTDMLNYTKDDIFRYFSEKTILHPCDEFLTTWCSTYTNKLDDDACILTLSGYRNKTNLLNTTCHSVHCVDGKRFLLNPQNTRNMPPFMLELIKKIQ